MVQGFCYLREPGLTPLAIALGSISVIAGVLLLAGLVTPIAGAVVAVMGVGVGTSVLPSCARPLFSSGVTVIFAATILVAITVLGPGAHSVDARLFGRREIIIPRKPQP